MIAPDTDWSRAILAQLRRELRRSEPHQPEFAVLERFRDKPGLFVDVGANLGQSIATLRLYSTAMRAVCFEPLPWLEPALAELQRLEFIDAYHIVALGDRSVGTVPLVVPWVDDVPLLTRATRHDAKFVDTTYQDALRRLANRPEGTVRLERVEVRCARLDDFALAPTILKVDVEGDELAVLRGAAGTINAHRPPVLMEPSRDRQEIAEFMRILDYAGYRWAVGNLIPWDGGPAENVWFESEGRSRRSRVDLSSCAHPGGDQPPKETRPAAATPA